MTAAVMWVERGHCAGTTLLCVRAPEDAGELRQTLVDAGFRWDCGALATAAPQTDIADLLGRLQLAGVELLDNGRPDEAQLLAELGLQAGRRPAQTRADWERVQAGCPVTGRPAAAPLKPIWAWQVREQHVWIWLLWLGALGGLLALSGVVR